jgi:hypothetical protein
MRLLFDEHDLVIKAIDHFLGSRVKKDKEWKLFLENFKIGLTSRKKQYLIQNENYEKGILMKIIPDYAFQFRDNRNDDFLRLNVLFYSNTRKLMPGYKIERY